MEEPGKSWRWTTILAVLLFDRQIFFGRCSPPTLGAAREDRCAGDAQRPVAVAATTGHAGFDSALPHRRKRRTSSTECSPIRSAMSQKALGRFHQFAAQVCRSMEIAECAAKSVVTLQQ